VGSQKGIIALMGSGELTATMVEVHKELLAGLQPGRRAVFLDTPAGFQLNADQLSQKAVEYFHDRIQQPMVVASFKSKTEIPPFEAEQAFHVLREAGFILVGPGSPTYAIRNWRQTPIPEIFVRVINNGGCLLAASAAALTVGRFALPVYEIYKVGEDLHWVDGLNILSHFGFNLVVVPHWNNAEGGSHDTRFCYMGGPRFEKLQSLLPEEVSIFGLDEHTACLLNLETDEAIVKGIGRVTLRRGTDELTFEKGERFPLGLLRGRETSREWRRVAPPSAPGDLPPGSRKESFWDRIHALQGTFYASLEDREPKVSVSVLLELDQMIWQARQDGESEEFISQAREVLREMIVSLGIELEAGPKDQTPLLAPLITELLELREKFRMGRKWHEADALRESLQRMNIVVEDTKDGPRWHPGP